MRRSVFNCGELHPWGTITLIQRVVPAKRSDWSERYSDCADNSHKAQPALMVGVPTLVGIISEIISNISCFSAGFHYHIYYLQENLSLHGMLCLTAALAHIACCCWSFRMLMCVCVCVREKLNCLRTVCVTFVSLSAGSVESPFEQGISPNNVPYYIK